MKKWLITTGLIGGIASVLLVANGLVSSARVIPSGNAFAVKNVGETAIEVNTPPETKTPAGIHSVAKSPPPVLSSLRGTRIPDGLLVDQNGNLIEDDNVRFVFDYFLAAQQDVSASTLEQLVLAHIEQTLDDPAAAQAKRLWHDYWAYLSDLDAALQTFDKPALVLAASDTLLSADQVDQLQAHFDLRVALQQQWLADVADAWFSTDNIYDQAMLSRYRAALSAPYPVAGKNNVDEMKASTSFANNPDYERHRAAILQSNAMSESEKLHAIRQLRSDYFPDRQAYIRQSLEDLADKRRFSSSAGG